MSFLQSLEHLLGKGQQPHGRASHQAGHAMPVAQSDGSNYQPMSNGGALVNNRAVYGPGVQEDTPGLGIQRHHPLRVHPQQGRINMQQDAGGYGAPIEGGYPSNVQGINQYTELPNLPQGGQFNPGFDPLQDRRPINYYQSPQHPFSLF